MLALTGLRMECEPGVQQRLSTAAFDHLDELRAQANLGHLFVRLIDWPIRRNSHVEVERDQVHALSNQPVATVVSV